MIFAEEAKAFIKIFVPDYRLWSLCGLRLYSLHMAATITADNSL